MDLEKNLLFRRYSLKYFQVKSNKECKLLSNDIGGGKISTHTHKHTEEDIIKPNKANIIKNLGELLE